MAAGADALSDEKELAAQVGKEEVGHFREENHFQVVWVLWSGCTRAHPVQKPI